MFSFIISKNLPPNSIASDDTSGLPTSYHDTPPSVSYQASSKWWLNVLPSPRVRLLLHLNRRSFPPFYRHKLLKGSWHAGSEQPPASTLNKTWKTRYGCPQPLNIRHLLLKPASARLTANRQPLKSWLFTPLTRPYFSSHLSQIRHQWNSGIP